jgi:hypothetical protein
MDFAQGFVPTRSLRLGQVYLAATLALSTATVGGCASTFAAENSRNSAHQVEIISQASIQLPDPALLRPQPEPACAFRGPVSDPMTAEEARQKLDYEQQCYRGSERIVRARLEQLQDAVQKMIKSRKATVASRSYRGAGCSTPVAELLMFLEGTSSRCSTGTTTHGNR